MTLDCKLALSQWKYLTAKNVQQCSKNCCQRIQLNNLEMTRVKGQAYKNAPLLFFHLQNHIGKFVFRNWFWLLNDKSRIFSFLNCLIHLQL